MKFTPGSQEAQDARKMRCRMIGHDWSKTEEHGLSLRIRNCKHCFRKELQHVPVYPQSPLWLDWAEFKEAMKLIKEYYDELM